MSQYKPSESPNDVDLLPILARIVSAAYRMGYESFPENAKFVHDAIKANFGDEVAEHITLNQLQGVYIGLGVEPDAMLQVVAFKSLEELGIDTNKGERELAEEQEPALENQSAIIKYFEEISDIERGIKLAIISYPPPETCDLCSIEIDKQPYFVDGALDDSSMWANMCPDCFAARGKAIAWGQGQLFMRYENDYWLCVAGFPN